MNVSIGVTVHNRHEVATKTIEAIKRYMPHGTKLIIVDDASDTPFPNSTFRFEHNVGITVAKNKCIQLMEFYDYCFLMDDDFEPTSANAFTSYIYSGLMHACYTFGRKELSRKPSYVEYEKPCGCVLYFRDDILYKVGGFDTDFKIYSYEHVNFSDRIFNYGLTPARYIDIPNSQGLFIMADCESSVPFQDRINSIAINEKLYKEKFNSTEFKPYK